MCPLDDSWYIQYIISHSRIVGHNYLAIIGIKVHIYPPVNYFWYPMGLCTNNAHDGLALQKL